jgi:hypothetical protein
MKSAFLYLLTEFFAVAALNPVLSLIGVGVWKFVVKLKRSLLPYYWPGVFF